MSVLISEAKFRCRLEGRGGEKREEEGRGKERRREEGEREKKRKILKCR